MGQKKKTITVIKKISWENAGVSENYHERFGKKWGAPLNGAPNNDLI